MANDIRQRFAEGVLDGYRARATKSSSAFALQDALVASALPVGHPEFHRLALGERASCNRAIAFIDMSRFTARSFWEPPEQVTSLALAVLTQVALIVQESGGFVLGLRGDGLMAGWGSRGSEPPVDVAMCLAACTVALDAAQGALRELLLEDGIEPVQLRAGVDFGRVDFVRTGTAQQSEVNVVGFAANFAAKCEKYANSWEVVIGEGASVQVPALHLLTTHARSPKQYQYGERRRTYAFHDFSWRRIIGEAVSAIHQVGGCPTAVINTSF